MPLLWQKDKGGRMIDETEIVKKLEKIIKHGASIGGEHPITAEIVLEWFNNQPQAQQIVRTPEEILEKFSIRDDKQWWFDWLAGKQV